MPWGAVTKARKPATGKKGEKGRFVTLRSGRVVFIPEGKRTKWADVKDKVEARKEGETQFRRSGEISPGDIKSWEQQVNEWKGARGGVGRNAVTSISRHGDDAIIVERDGELKGITAVSVPREVRGLFGTETQGNVVVGMYMATKEKGAGDGLRMMQKVAEIAAEGGWSLRTNPTEGAKKFIESIGMEIKPYGMVDMTPEEVRTWLEEVKGA